MKVQIEIAYFNSKDIPSNMKAYDVTNYIKI